jgi:hypothetical protein
MKKLYAVILMAALFFIFSFSKDKEGKNVVALDNQDKWAKCTLCSSLFYDGYSNKGRCQATGGHVSDGKEYILTYNSSGPGQHDWRYCNKCKALFFDGYTTKGVCKGGGGHLAAGYNFILRSDAKAPGERNWRFCNKCESLFFDEKSNKGVCAARCCRLQLCNRLPSLQLLK